ncbi:MAG: hypothetical protein Q9165_002340 [Trypethelium subeluteriae]
MVHLKSHLSENKVISSTKHGAAEENNALHRFVADATRTRSCSKTLVRGSQKRTYLLWILPIDEASTWSREDAIAQVERVLRGDDGPGDSNFLFASPTGSSFLVIISRYVHATAQSLGIDTRERLESTISEDEDESRYAANWFRRLFKRGYDPVAMEGHQEATRRSAKAHLIRYLAIALCLFLLLAFVAILISSPNHPWQRFIEVDGSVGPRYQLQLKPDNVTAWASAQKDMDSSWFLRIDDGAVYPKDLLEDKEIEYQEWLYDRYPEVNSIRTSGKYLSPEYLSHPDINDMLIDKYFHISHCVHSMRRYWIAKETGESTTALFKQAGSSITSIQDTIYAPWI